jgi:rubrerythrin
MKYILLILVVLKSHLIYCQTDYNYLLIDKIINNIETNYPGYKVKLDAKPLYYQFIKYIATKDSITSYDDFIKKANFYISFFEDKHIYLVEQKQRDDEYKKHERQEKSQQFDGFEFKALDKGISYLKISSFDTFYENEVESLVFKNYNSIRKRKYLIIDLRDNGGGEWDCIVPLTLFFRRSPKIDIEWELHLSKDNIEAYSKKGSILIDNDVTKVISTISKETPFSRNRYFKRRRAHITKKPKYVAILVNENTGSAAEIITLYAKQSIKVKVFGSITAGAVNYGDVIKKPVIENMLYIAMPIQTNLSLNQNDVDAGGITPDFLLNRNEDFLLQTIRIMKNWK